MNLSYEDVIEYLADREGDSVTVTAYPSFGFGGPTLLGLTISGLTIAKVDAVKQYEEQWLEGRAGVRIHLTALEKWAHLPDDGLVLTREWFGAAVLDDELHSELRVIVRANVDAPALYPPVGKEPPEQERDAPLSDFVGWGFGFDFDGDAPYRGRWALR